MSALSKYLKMTDKGESVAQKLARMTAQEDAKEALDERPPEERGFVHRRVGI